MDSLLPLPLPLSLLPDEGCSEDLESFPLLSGESVEYLGSSGDDHLVITNFRFFATQEAGVYNVSGCTYRRYQELSSRKFGRVQCSSCE